MSDTSPARVPLRLILLLFCGAVAVVFWRLQLNPYLNVANDAGRYMVLGESLARTGELRLINDVRQPLDTLYPPGFPAIIAFWLKVTGRDAGGVVLWVKFTQLLFLLGTLPLLRNLLERARLSAPYVTAALFAAAICPALSSYANEIMSEIPFLFFCLASVLLVERDLRKPPEEDVLTWRHVTLSLLCAACAFLMRTAGISLFLALALWFGSEWRRRPRLTFGPDLEEYGAVQPRKKIFGYLAATVLVTLVVMGGWQLRNRQIVWRAPPGVHYQTYADQFSLKDPSDPNAGRIALTPRSLLGRAAHSFPIYAGMVPRAVLHSMSRGTAWFFVFYAAAVPFGLLIAGGYVAGWGRELRLSGLFCGLFWLFAAMWPWRDPRFLVPLLPFLLLYAFLGAERLATRLPASWKRVFAGVQGVGYALLCVYLLHVQFVTTKEARKPTAPGYALGRNAEEGGFYAACDWLKRNAEPGAVVMGRPAYLLHLYSGHPTTQIEPNERPRVQEIQYIQKGHVRYLVQDAWYWSNSNRYLVPYLNEYGALWRLAWQDRSGVRVWERLATPQTSPAVPSPGVSLPAGKREPAP